VTDELGEVVTIVLLLLALGAASPDTFTVAPNEDLAVYEAGEGTPVVLLPGLSGCAYGFRKITPLLHEQGYRTIIIEPLALGQSARPEGADYTLTAQAERVATVLDELDVREALVVAHGVGFSMALRLALARPDQVGSLVSIEGGPAESAATPMMKTGLKMAKLLKNIVGDKFIRDGAVNALKDSSGDPSWVSRSTARQYIWGARRDMDGTLNAFIAMAEQPEPFAVTPRLGEVSQPVLVLIGAAEHDGALKEEDIAILRDGLPDVTFRSVAGAGHFIYEEQPETTVAALVEFQRRVLSLHR
jgi:pimeloyl-ACP methyl ester carboxylesterase